MIRAFFGKHWEIVEASYTSLPKLRSCLRFHFITGQCALLCFLTLKVVSLVSVSSYSTFSHLAQVCDLRFKNGNESLRLGQVKKNFKVEQITKIRDQARLHFVNFVGC